MSDNSSRVLKLEWLEDEGTLVFKGMHYDEFTFSKVFTLTLNRVETIEMLDDICGCLRDSSSMTYCRYGKYLVDVYPNKGNMTIEVFEVVNKDGSKGIGKTTFNSYIGGKSLLDGIRSFIKSIR